MNCDIRFNLDNIIRVGQKEEQEKTITPTKESQEVFPDLNKTLSKVIVEPIPDDYIIPSGDLEINEQGIFNVKEYESVNVKAPFDKLFNQYLNKTLTEITEQDLEGATSLRDNLFSGQSKLKKAIMPDTITSIGASCFQSCSVLQEIKLSKGLKGTIPRYAFAYCLLLNKIDIPEGVTTIGNGSWGEGAFRNCDNLTEIHLPSTVRSIVAGSFLNYYLTPNVFIKDIGAFSTMTCGPVDTGDYKRGGVFNKFYLYLNDVLVTDLVVTDDTYTIGKGVFCYCLSIKTADLKNVSVIYQDAFCGSSGLVSVRIGENLTRIDSEAFVNCGELKKIVIDKPCTTASDVPVLSATNAIPSSAYIYVPDTTTQELYKSATNWSSFADKILVKEDEE